jgi:hypothetical protein
MLQQLNAREEGELSGEDVSEAEDVTCSLLAQVKSPLSRSENKGLASSSAVVSVPASSVGESEDVAIGSGSDKENKKAKRKKKPRERSRSR